MHISWLGYVVRGLGLLAAFCAAAPLVVPRLRSFLALFGLATPPGERAPWNPKHDEIPPSEVAPTIPAGPLALLVVLLGTLASSTAFAQTTSPPAGGCFSPTLCVGPSASLTVAQFNLATSNFSGGVSPGIGYGLTYTPTVQAWAAVGADIYASTKIGQGVPNQVSLALTIHWLNIYLGVGPSIIQGASGQPVTVQWSFMAGPGVQVQSSVAAYKASAGQQ